LAKNKLRAMGLNMGYEHDKGLVDAYQKIYDQVDEAKVDKGMIFGKDAARNERRFGTKGKFDPQGSGPRGQDISQRAKLAVKRKKEHEARRGVKTKGMGEAYVVNQADKTSNTPAYQGMKAGKKNKLTGEPLYKKADNMKENLVTISNINVKPSAYKGEKDAIKDILNKEVAQENYRAMRNPKEDKPESEMSYDEKRKKRMNDPKRGINSPAFKKFMASQGM